jgi:hypothetical protein
MRRVFSLQIPTVFGPGGRTTSLNYMRLMMLDKRNKTGEPPVPATSAFEFEMAIEKQVPISNLVSSSFPYWWNATYSNIMGLDTFTMKAGEFHGCLNASITLTVVLFEAEYLVINKYIKHVDYILYFNI